MRLHQEHCGTYIIIMMKFAATFLGLLLLASAVSADSITTIELQNRPAEEIMRIVEPMLGPDDAISGQGYTLVLRASPTTRKRVEEIIEFFDVPARIVRISVFQGSDRDVRSLGISGGIQVERGDASVDIGSTTDNDSNPGGSVTYSTDSGSVSVDGISTDRRLRDSPVHQVRVAEGSEAYIETGEQIPQIFGTGWILPGRATGGIEYRNVTTGFWVLARIHGDNVTLEISPFRNARDYGSGGNVTTQQAGTTITGQMSQWLLVGGVTEQVERSERSTGKSVSTQGGADSSIWIRADLAE